MEEALKDTVAVASVSDVWEFKEGIWGDTVGVESGAD
jgi:uncharacterized protein YkvS